MTTISSPTQTSVPAAIITTSGAEELRKRTTESRIWSFTPETPAIHHVSTHQAHTAPDNQDNHKDHLSSSTSPVDSPPHEKRGNYTLSAAKYSPPKRASKPIINLPAPHLPLRKRASNELRLRTSGSYFTQDPANQQSMAQMAQLLRPETARWSRDSIKSQPTESSLPLATPDLRSAISQRPNTANDLFEENDADTLSPLLRPVTSVSEYMYTKNGHRSTPNSSHSPDKSPSHHFSTINSSRLPSTFWRDGGAGSIRESILSATTTDGSSAANTPSTSVWTARSSRTTYDSSIHDDSKASDEDFSVEDYISMYVEGFRDDEIEEMKRASMRKSIQPPVPPLPKVHDTSPAQPTQSLSGASEALEHLAVPSTRSSDTLTDISRSPISSQIQAGSSQRRPPKILRDLYGFKHESQYVTANRYKAWHKDYNLHLERRKKKWVYLMNSCGLPNEMFPEKFPPRSQEVKRFIRKGIPPEWRGAAWFYYGDGAAFLTANPGLYDRLLKHVEEGALPENYRDMIERDLNRTFPDNIHFKPESPSTYSIGQTAQAETDIIKSLRRILQAFAVHTPKVGYCQSLNFLAGLLLLFMRLSFPAGNFEERAFALLCILTDKYLPGTHGVVLEGCNVDIGVLMTLLQETMPGIWSKFDNNNRDSLLRSGRRNTRASVTLHTGTEDLPTVSLATTAWFMSCFVGTLPIESVCRVWDCLWYEGSKTIFRVALAIFKLGEKQIRKTSDPAEVFQIIQTLPKGLLDANELMQVATMKSRGMSTRLGAGTPGFGALSQKTVETRRQERRAFAKGINEPSDGSTLEGMIPPPVPEGAGGLKRSRTRGTLRRLKSMKKVTTTATLS